MATVTETISQPSATESTDPTELRLQATVPRTGFARMHSVGLLGVRGQLVEVEVHLAAGLPACKITGLADTAVAEARDRVRAAVINSGEKWPDHRITIGLGPAWLPKHGSAFDVAMALAVLAAHGQIDQAAVRGCVFLGELGLSGRIRSFRGLLPAVVTAANAGFSTVFVPIEQVAEARLVEGIDVIGVGHLRQTVEIVRGEVDPPPLPETSGASNPATPPCLSEVAGQELGRFAVEVAAAGGHHIALMGPPGAGKTMLAQRLPGILPHLDRQEALEVTALHSVAGASVATELISIPPFQAPHHTSTMPALVGGGAGIAKPGAVSLAHRGVLFLDEATEFPPRVLDALREPLERGEVVLARAGGVAHYPARFQLVLAANPCPCGAARTTDCACGPMVRRRYLGRLSGPLMDRIDIQVELPPVTPAALLSHIDAPESSAVVAARVREARATASQRWKGLGWSLNAQVPGSVLRGHFRLPSSVSRAADRALQRGELSARGYDRVLRLAWTLADVAGHTGPTNLDVARATELRLRRAL